MARGRKDYEKAVIAVESEGFVNPHGRILMHDDFEDTPLKWVPSGAGTWFVSRQARAAYNGSFGLELDILSELPPLQRVARAARLIPLDVTRRTLTELFWRASDLTRLDYLELGITRYTGTVRDVAAIRYSPAMQYWEYWNDVPAWTQIPGSNQRVHDDAWNELSLSADYSTNEYMVFKSNDVEINMEGTALSTPVDPTAPYLAVTLQAYNITGNQLLVCFDDVVTRELET